MTAGPIRRHADGITVTIRLTPKGGADRIEGVAADAACGSALKARVTAAPESGKANAALIRLLAKSWRLPKSAVTIAGGVKDRTKVVHIAGDAAALERRIAQWIEKRHD